MVLRPRLIKRLNEGLHRKLSLISAPAGFGKTTLVSEWVTGSGRATAWLSLDEADNDPTRFLAYFVAALQTLVLSGAEGLAPNIGEGVLGLLRSPQPPPIESLLTALLNEITAIPEHFMLVLDDYHVLDAKAIDQMLTFLLKHLPPQMHLVIATREDPHLPLASLRVRGKLTELRAADLRFTASEAAGFLNEMMGLNLAAEEIVALETRTEGWIAGLQMAALALQRPLSMQGRAESASFIEAFTGSHRFVLDYLVEEVLQRQPEDVRHFLLQTAILDRLSGSLCDAVTGQEDGKGMLELLERANLFVIPLDDQRQWYRYHHLFADVLQARLMKEQPERVSRVSRVSILHQRASEWYEQNDLRSDAVRHALAGQDFERAAGLVELAWPTMRRSKQDATVLGWVKALPDKLIRARPVLSVVYALALLDNGELDAAEARLRDAERWLGSVADINDEQKRPAPTPSGGRFRGAEMVVVDDAQFQSLPASIANTRAYRAQALGDVPATVRYARQALDLLAESDYYERGTSAALLGLAYWASGELKAAHRWFADGLAIFQNSGGILIAIGGTLILAHIKTAQGRLHEAVRTYEHSLQLATTPGEPGKPVLQGTAELYMGLSELHLEQGDLEAAKVYLLKGEALGEQASLPGFEFLWDIARARIKEAEGDLDGALDLLNEAERLYRRIPSIPDVRPAALKVRVWVKQGRLAEALSWVRERELSADDDLSYLREYEHLTLARVLIARYKSNRADRSMINMINEAVGLLSRLLNAAEEGERMGSVIEILMLQALAHHAQDDTPAALLSLSRALTLAEPEGYVRLFVDEGMAMAQLLRETAARGIMQNYTRKLLAAFDALPPLAQTERVTLDSASRQRANIPPPQPLIEPLTERELDVLRLLKTELSGPEIARQLVIALSTVRTHTKRIYSKLNVKNRRAAVKRATELDLI